MPSKNMIDWEVRRVWITNLVEQLLADSTNEFTKPKHCLQYINDEYGILSVSQLFRALKPHKDTVVNPNQVSINFSN